MNNQYYKIIKDLRNKKGLKQEEIAEKIDISRSSYISFEQGKTELNFSQIIKLADIFGVSLEEVESGVTPNNEKYKEMMLAYIRKGSSTDGKIGKTKLAKMLYLADFAWFYNHLESMSGMQYRRIQYGPVPDRYFGVIDELETTGEISVDHKNDMFLISENESSQKRTLKKISKEEMTLINKIARKWKDRKTNEIVHFTHNQLPYKICSPNEIIPYELITQEDPEYVY
jgi:transcriptional regulator with XRE-family HTH domain